jgi:hypothetical protein
MMNTGAVPQWPAQDGQWLATPVGRQNGADDQLMALQWPPSQRDHQPAEAVGRHLGQSAGATPNAALGPGQACAALPYAHCDS